MSFLKRIHSIAGILVCVFALLAPASVLAIDKHGIMGEDVGAVNAIRYGATPSTRTHATIQAAITALGGATRTVFLDNGTWTISANLIIPANITLWVPTGTTVAVTGTATMTQTGPLRVEAGGQLCPASTATLAINGPVDMPLWKVFCPITTTTPPSSRVRFTNNSHVESIYPQWWGALGDGTTDDYQAFMALVDSLTIPPAYASTSFAPDSILPRGHTLRLTDGRFKVCLPIVLPRNWSFNDQANTIWIKGNGPNTSTITAQTCGGFPSGHGVIEWNDSDPNFYNASYGTFNPQEAIDQNISDLEIVAPPVAGTFAVYFIATSYARITNTNLLVNNRLQLRMERARITMSADFHDYGIAVFSSCWTCFFSNIALDTYTQQVSNPPHNPVLFYGEPLLFPGFVFSLSFSFDGSGFVYSHFENIRISSRTRCAPTGFFAGRAAQTTMIDIVPGCGVALPGRHVVWLKYSGAVSITNINVEGGVADVPVLVEDSENVRIIRSGVGAIRYGHGYSTSLPLARASVEFRNCKGCIVDEDLGGSRGFSSSLYDYQFCQCRSGASVGQQCQTATPPCQLNISGVAITCAGGDSVCFPQDIRQYWLQAKCAGGANDGQECGATCTGGSRWDGHTCYTNDDCWKNISSGNPGYGVGTCTPYPNSGSLTACGTGQCAQTNPGFRFLNLPLPGPAKYEIWVPYSQYGPFGQSGHIVLDGYEAQVNATLGYGQPVGLPASIWGSTGAIAPFAVEVRVDDVCIEGEAVNGRSLRAYTGVIQVPSDPDAGFSTILSGVTAAGGVIACSCRNPLPNFTHLDASLPFDNFFKATLFNTRDVTITSASAECTASSGQYFVSCGYVRCEIFPR